MLMIQPQTRQKYSALGFRSLYFTSARQRSHTQGR